MTSLLFAIALAQTCEVTVVCDGVQVQQSEFDLASVCPGGGSEDTGGAGNDTGGAAGADTAVATTGDTGLTANPANYQRILLINADDIGYGILTSQTSYAHPAPIAPGLDTLANTGIVFSQNYAAPNCSPSRAQLLTSRIAARDNVRDVAWPINEGALANSWLWAFVLDGWATWGGGKWHEGGIQGNPGVPVLLSGRDPTQAGFQSWTMTEAWYEGGTALVSTEGSTHPPATQAPTPWYSGTEAGDVVLLGADGRNGSEVLLDQAIAFFAANPNKSIAYVALGDAHTPYTAQLDDYDTAWSAYTNAKEAPGYMAEARQLDNAITSRLALMDAQGLLDGTLVIFTSDNGARSWQGFQAYPNGDMYGYKADVYEGGIRTPLIYWATDIAGQARTVQGVVSHLDLGATLTDFFGVPYAPPLPIDGESYAAALRGDPWVRNNDLVVIGPSQEHVSGEIQDYALIKADGCLKLERVDGNDGIVDLCTDPGGHTDVTTSYPTELALMQGALNAAVLNVEADAATCPSYNGGTGGCGPQPTPRQKWTTMSAYDGIRSTICPSFQYVNAGWNAYGNGCAQ